jgi:hypothetical protein
MVFHKDGSYNPDLEPHQSFLRRPSLSITCSSGRLTAFRIGSMPKLAPKKSMPKLAKTNYFFFF